MAEIIKTSKGEKIFLLIIFLLGWCLRFYQLGRVPAGLLADEAAVGYNAYSLIKTGKDEFGQAWPLFFRSFGEGKLPLYVYQAVLPVLVFGLRPFSVRFMPAFLGSLTVLVLYLLIKEWLGFLAGAARKKWADLLNWPEEALAGRLALLASFSLAVMPWHIHFSRGVFGQECVFWTVFGSWLFLVGNRKQSVWLKGLAFLSFSFSLLTYHSARVFTPLWLVGLVMMVGWRKKKDWGKSKRWWLSQLLSLALFIGLPSLLILKSPVGGARAGGVSILHPQSGVQIKLEEKLVECRGKPAWLIRGLHNKVESYARDLGQRYFSHFDPSFLFFQGDPLRPRYRVPDVGQLLLVQAPFFMVGLYWLFRLGFWPMVVWLGLGPVASALTFETPSSVRAIYMTVPLAVAVGLGLSWAWAWLNQRKGFVRLLVWLGLGVVLVWNLVYYWDAYYLHQEVHQPYYWQYGYQELVSRVNQLEGDYERVEITDKRGTPYIFFLFYNQYPPKQFQAQVWSALEPAKKFSFHAIRSLDNLRFVPEKCPAKAGRPGILYVCTQEDQPTKAIKKGLVEIIEIVEYQDGQPAFILMEWLEAKKVGGETDG